VPISDDGYDEQVEGQDPTHDLTLDEMITITKEAILEIRPSLKTAAALAFRVSVEAEVRAIKAGGQIPELPFD
jgi:hypothetical protein